MRKILKAALSVAEKVLLFPLSVLEFLFGVSFMIVYSMCEELDWSLKKLNMRLDE